MNRTSRSMVIVLAASVALSSAGCASRAGNGAVIIAGGMVSVGGAVVGNSGPSATYDENAIGPNFDFSQEVGVGLVLLGVGLMAVGAIGLMHDPDDTAEGGTASHSTQGPMGAAAISESDRLGIRAAHAAQGGDCATVRLDVAMMHAMDPDYASALVDHDPQIRACMNG